MNAKEQLNSLTRSRTQAQVDRNNLVEALLSKTSAHITRLYLENGTPKKEASEAEDRIIESIDFLYNLIDANYAKLIEERTQELK